MNRDELLDLAFPFTPVRDEGARIFDLTETDEENPQIIHVRSTVTLGYRRVIVRPTTAAPGAGIAQAASTLVLATIANVATDPDHRGKGYASSLIRSAHEEAATHETIDYLAVFAADAAEFFARFGYEHPPGSPEGFMVAPVRPETDPWPGGRVDTRGGW